MSDISSGSTPISQPVSGKRRTFHAIAAVATLGFLGKAVAQGMPGPGGRGDMSAMAERRVDHLIKLVNGTPEQKTKLLALAQAAMADMKPMREQLSAARKRGMELLSAASIDRSGIDKLRGEQIQLMDGISRRMSAHMMDAAEVLTPVQRTIVADKMKQRGEGRGHRGHGGGYGGGHGGGWFR
ncbi:periplasmic heavy metal sensor [Variovorax sp. PCZ-1]|uniref:Spy/CpxP family protein refolding chaperone n=1 Tax=Variovorax sp. PCZ-1 TaxID=2835533 RepID=UPI001BCB95AD|nr:periplasmic heavy metal sensor [Variovorax sp. PCZ-1]MBS7808869.1 periplasmic heavy metal sensor [Variovorax sp. PCZ-1]